MIRGHPYDCVEFLCQGALADLEAAAIPSAP